MQAAKRTLFTELMSFGEIANQAGVKKSNKAGEVELFAPRMVVPRRNPVALSSAKVNVLCSASTSSHCVLQELEMLRAIMWLAWVKVSYW